jgi:hypothetical protein
MLFIFIVFFIFYVSITRGHFVGTDEIALYQTTRSIWENGDLTIEPINNTFMGRHHTFYSQYNIGQSVAALPLYGLGKNIGVLLSAVDKDSWIPVFGGPSIGHEPNRWGGDIEIFFVNLFNCFVIAMLCSVFFIFTLRLGAAPQWALLNTAFLGLTSYVAPFSTGFLQHPSEALFLLSAFYFLYLYAHSSNRTYPFLAGSLTGFMILFRLPSIIALPPLFLYLLLSLVRQRKENDMKISVFKRFFLPLSAFCFPVLASFILHLTINFVKFETIWGKYNNEGFHTPLFKGLYGFLFSPGNSIFLFTPLLLLIPWTFSHFWKRHPLETYTILFLSLSYVVFYGTYTSWHGLWSALGPRYLVPIVPLLLLPLGPWMNRVKKKGFVVIGLLALIGVWVQLVHVAVNFAFVYHSEGYPNFQPPYAFLFIPDTAPVVAHSKALLSGDYRVDMWIVNIYRNYGIHRLMLIVTPLIAVFGWALWMLKKKYRNMFSHTPDIKLTSNTLS